MACNFMSNIFMFFQPFFLYYLIDYIKYGQNKVDSWGIHFYDFSDVDKLEWLT